MSKEGDRGFDPTDVEKPGSEKQEHATPGTEIGKNVAEMDGQRLQEYIESFQKGSLDDGTAMIIMGRIKEMKISGQITKPEATMLLVKIDDRLED